MSACHDIFKSNCEDIIANTHTSKIVSTNKLIFLAAKIGKKYPFVLLSEFIEDFMNGMFNSKMQRKYHLHDKDFNNLIYNILKIDGIRSKDPKLDNMAINLKNTKWKEQYELVTSQSHIFESEFVNMLNCNILRAIFVYSVLNSQYISNQDVNDKVITTYEKLKKLDVFPNIVKFDLFENYLNDGLGQKLQNMTKDLSEMSLLTSIDGDISLPTKYSNTVDYAHNIVAEMKDGMSHNSLRTKILNEFPLFKITFETKIVDIIFNELETQHNVVRKRTFWKYSPGADQLFTHENYTVKMEKINKQIVSKGRTKFFGRDITPDQFISELKTLELGDLDDLDDQVTRMAGLVLSDSVQLQSPRENMKEFDFIVDITNYNFRPEQEEMMKKLDFQANSKIFHCKVMINNIITASIMKKLKNSIPSGEQGVIFTCKPITKDILKQIKNDRTIQIITEKGIHDWCSITPTIPCRRHSVARIMYGDGAGKTVLVKSLNYESGLATVEITPNHEESTFQIGCLKEVNLHVTNQGNFESASNVYFDFLCMMEDLSSDILENGINTKIIKMHTTHIDLIKSTHPELFDGPHPQMPYDENSSKHTKYVEFDDVHVKINLQRSFDCTCKHRLNEEHYYTLCKHLIAAFDYFCIDGLDWPVIRRRIELISKQLDRFQDENIEKTIDSIYYVIKSKQLFKAYLQKYLEMD